MSSNESCSKKKIIIKIIIIIIIIFIFIGIYTNVRYN